MRKGAEMKRFLSLSAAFWASVLQQKGLKGDVSLVRGKAIWL